MASKPQPELRLAEVVAALSLATDLGTGHPIERSLRSCLLAVHFGEALGLPAHELSEIYYVALLRWAGCTADSHRADLFGDEIALGVKIDSVQLWNPAAMLQFLWQTIGVGEPPLRRAQMLAGALASGIKRSEVAAIAHCEVAQSIANRLGLAQDVIYALGQIFERWDGHGIPGLVHGEALALSVRVVQIAMDAELFYRLGGVEAALAVVRRRSGSSYDPQLAERFCREGTQLLHLFELASVWEDLLAAEPAPHHWLAGVQIDDALCAIADFTDLRSPTTIGHSQAVADLAGAAALRCGLAESDVRAVRRAGLVHDVGMTSVSISLCEKPGPLSEGEWERIRLHTYYTERILSRPRSLAHIGALAALHHERLNGTGYHRGLPATLLSPAARILAAADVYQSLIEVRPYRPAHTPDAAAAHLRDEVQAGRLDGEAVAAVLEAAGHRVRKVRRTNIAGLSEREIEVLRLIARGLSNRQMARQLVISERTVDHHIRHIYSKIAVSTRAAATLFAMQHQLLGDTE